MLFCNPAIMNWMKMIGLLIHLICLLILPLSVHSLDTACAHVTDKNTTVTVTQIRYNHKFYTRIALASKYEYQSSLEDASTSLYRTTANDVKDEIEIRFETTRGDSPTLYDVVVVRFTSVASSPSFSTFNLPADITLLADIIISTSNDEVGVDNLETTLLLAAMLADTSRLFYVITTPSTVDVCLREVIHTSQGLLTWHVTEVGINQGTTEKCPVGFERAGELSVSVRTCSRDAAGHAAWAQFTCTNCGSVTQEGGLLELGEQITKRGENDPNLIIIRNAIELLRDTDEITSVSILAVAEILEALARTGNVSTEVLQEVTTLLSLALAVDVSIIVEAETLYFSSSRINGALVTILSITHFRDRLNVTTTSANVNLGIRRLVEGTIDFSWYGLSVDSDQRNSGSGSSLHFYDNQLLAYDEDLTASVHFQFGDLPTPGQSDVRLTYVMYPMDKLFQPVITPTSLSGNEGGADGWVMSLHLAGVEGQIRSTVTTTSRPTIQTVEPPVCGTWNATMNGGHGDWIQDGCQLAEILDGDLVVCQCETRGTFALIKGVTAEPLVYPRLNALVFVGIMVAFLGALLSFLVLICIKSLRKRQLYRMEAAFCFPVAIFYLAFAAGQSAPSSTTGCTVVAGILHCFILICTCSTVAITAKFYDTSRRKAVASKRFALYTLAAAWGAPIVIVCVTVASAQVVYKNAAPLCFLNRSNPYPLIFALVLPMVACLMGVFIIIILTERNIRKPDTTVNQEGVRKPWAWLTSGRMIRMMFLFIMCYATWFLLFFVVYNLVPILQNLFGVFAILQGLAFPIILCILDEDVKLATMAVFGKGAKSTSSRSFRPYFSASHWHPNPDIVPVDAPKQFLDNTQRNSTLTRQNFDPTVIPLSDTEQRRMGKGNGRVNTVAEQSGEQIEMTSLRTVETRDYSAYEEPIGSLTPSPIIIGKDRSERVNGHAKRIAVEAEIEYS